MRDICRRISIELRSAALIRLRGTLTAYISATIVIAVAVVRNNKIIQAYCVHL